VSGIPAVAKPMPTKPTSTKPTPFAEFLLDLLSPLGPVVYRRMFGGAGLFLGERMFAILDDETLYLKADDESRGAFEAAGMTPFVYEGGTRTVALPYHRVPAELVDDPDGLIGWARKAVEAAMRAKAKRPKSKRGARKAKAKAVPVPAKKPKARASLAASRRKRAR
jgi:DNA transformation protein